MIEDLEKYLKINTPGKKFDEKLDNIQEKILLKLYKETDFFKFISLYGLFCSLKLYSIWPYTTLSEEINEYFKYFINYLKNEKIQTKGTNDDYDCEEYFENIRDYFPIYNFSYAIIKDEVKRKLFSYACLVSINNSHFLLYLCMCLVKFKKGIIFEFDNTFNDLNHINKFELFKEFYKSIYQDLVFNAESNTIIVTSFNNNKFCSKLIPITNEEILSQINNNNYYFEVNCLNLNNQEKKLINIKTNIENSLTYLNMIEVQKLFKEINDKLDHREKEFKRISEENKSLLEKLDNQKKNFENQQNEINDLKMKLYDFEQKYNNLKGRFIYKSFYDYILLIFGIPIEETSKNKEILLEKKMETFQIKSKTFEYIVHDMKNYYLTQTGESHWVPEAAQIKKYILSLYNEFEGDDERDEKKILKKFFEKCCPEKEIIQLIHKNNEFTLNNNSDKDPLIKKQDTIKINKEINNLLNNARKEQLLTIIKEIVSNF